MQFKWLALLILVVLNGVFLVRLERASCNKETSFEKRETLVNRRDESHKANVSILAKNESYSIQTVRGTSPLQSSHSESKSKQKEISNGTNSQDPFWSIILAARNDDYGDNFIQRFQNFVRMVSYLESEVGISVELLITEWNPIENKPRLKDIIVFPDSLNVRIITVPNSIHLNFKHPELFHIHEFIAKNVAARRSRGIPFGAAILINYKKGKWLLFTNADNLFNDALGKLLKNTTFFDSNSFYRTSRIDFRHKITNRISPSQYWSACRSTAFRIGRTGWRTFNNDEERNQFWNEWEEETLSHQSDGNFIKSYPKLVNDYHVMAAGDFFAIEAKRFIDLRGYPEKETYGHWDSFMLMIAKNGGKMSQVNLIAPFATCHQDHSRVETKFLPPTPLTYWNNVIRGENIQFNKENWGLKSIILNENVFVDGKWENRKSTEKW